MRIAFVSTRFAGTDGVSLETQKLVHVLQKMGHEVFYCAGELDNKLAGRQIPALHFQTPLALELSARAFAGAESDPALELMIAGEAAALKGPLRQFLVDFNIQYVIIQNAFAIPMQLPLAQALTEVMAELQLPGLAHNHDFYWERPRYQTNRIPHFLDTFFPPSFPGLRHAVINSAAGRALQARRGLPSTLIPNVFDFATPAPGIDDYNADFRRAIGLTEEDWLILQPTRVIPRKGIELAIDLLSRLADARAKLVITHQAGDEGLDYLRFLENLALEKGVDLRYVADRIHDFRQLSPAGAKIYSLWDTYPHADLISYPSLIEGFGNALLETIYFRKPAFVNRYQVYAEDIGPLGFQFAELDGAITDAAVAQVRTWLEEPHQAQEAVAHNYQLALQHYSYETLAKTLQQAMFAAP